MTTESEMLRGEIHRLRNVIATGGAMYRAERAVMGIPGGFDPEQEARRAEVVGFDLDARTVTLRYESEDDVRAVARASLAKP